jgi:hypothetical protein
MDWSIPEEIQKELEFLDIDKKEKVLRYIHRENEVGRYPSKDELLEIIRYLKGKSIKEARKQGRSTNLTTGETLGLSYERQPKDYLKIYNCIYCEHQKLSTCTQPKSPLFKMKIKETVLCALFEEKD